MDDEDFDLTNHDNDQLIELAYSTIETLVNELEHRGMPGEVVDTVLFLFWQQRMYEFGDREDYLAVLEDALNDEWPEGPTIH